MKSDPEVAHIVVDGMMDLQMTGGQQRNIDGKRGDFARHTADKLQTIAIGTYEQVAFAIATDVAHRSLGDGLGVDAFDPVGTGDKPIYIVVGTDDIGFAFDESDIVDGELVIII